MYKNRRLKMAYGLEEGDRVTITERTNPSTQGCVGEVVAVVHGVIYQMYEAFVVVRTSYGTHPSYPWRDFLKWRTK
ncbi:Uncharacterised protein [uncultured Clostridium sp.]|nr:Uncharacterised protein [uncultured Clostridium sp.]